MIPISYVPLQYEASREWAPRQDKVAASSRNGLAPTRVVQNRQTKRGTRDQRS
ncbi:hypothetical protein SCLCIDRAFT_1219297 [Scleroderma citrinum Foug A]|uniref:Uncharacterized protein n=1 Tax=Scleroderma citrinum Foug A TaxID=1036808 RepID=A0A0C2Z6K4_9AGAM|nr:hypothetical protein SCLCIDRAFT_1219297 [Scleroderma citrinum Foug A]